MAKVRVFISFDYDHDEGQKHLLVGQAKNPDSPFELADWSVKEHIDGNWKEKVKTRLNAIDVVCILCGKHMGSASGVNAEIKIAQEIGKPYFLLEAYSDGATKPSAAKPGDKLYRWTWDNLKLLIAGSR
jgi:hypothetical protein